MSDPIDISPLERDRQHYLDVTNHNFHDATLQSIRLLPAPSEQGQAQIEVLLAFPRVELLFSVTFAGCTNVSLALDFDVLANNLPYNTAGFTTLTDASQIRDFIKSQVPLWNVAYDDIDSPSAQAFASGCSPLNAKLEKTASLTLHRISYFGGELSIVAASHEIRRLPFEPETNESTG